ncbi:MAG: histidine phosphatase family protein [Gemmatimonadota bacterium]|nr:MAG: histidine phosphatase family protein [Gemmatimonadota bacterium]
MDVVVVRHAIAEDRETFAQSGKPDTERPLTEQGRERMQRGARGLKQLVPHLDILATSPLVRAVETAKIISAAYGDIEPTTVAALRPEARAQAALTWLQDQTSDATLALVGHEPHLSMLVSWLASKSDEPFLEFKKGGACLLSFYHDIYAGGALLRWLLTPAQLRALGG